MGERASSGGWTLLASGKSAAAVRSAAESLDAPQLEVTVADSLYHAVAEFAREARDVVALDLDGMNDRAFECIELFRDLSPSVHILGLYSGERRDAALRALETGADVCLPQPFYPDEIALLITRWIERKRTDIGGETDYESRLEAMARLAKGIAHRINNPLMTISGWLEMMTTAAEDEAEAARLKSLQEEAGRIAAVVEQLSAFGQEMPDDCQTVEIDALLAEVIELEQSESPDLTVDIALGAGGARVWGDPQLLRKACRILLGSPLQNSGPRAVRVSTRPPKNGYVEIRIHNRDSRALCQEAADLFEPFSDGEDADRVPLAYPAAYGIVRGHGGALALEGTGESAEFVMRLPRRVSERP